MLTQACIYNIIILFMFMNIILSCVCIMINIAHGNISEIDLTNLFLVKLRIKYKYIIKLNF